MNLLKIVFPTDEPAGLAARRGAHFGKAGYYTIALVEKTGKVRDVLYVPNPGHKAGGCGNAVANIKSLEADALVVSGIGANPLKGFLKAGITVYHDSANPTVESSLNAYLSGGLSPIRPEQACGHHAH